jgi:hypothetical protein
MKPSRFASFACIALAPFLTQCDATLESQQPATPQNAIAPGGAQPSPAAPQQPAATASGDDTMYASDEYAIGEDPDSYQDNDPSALTDFRAPLEPYGTWVDDSTYGTVWVPSSTVVGAEFVPYSTAGHWVYDDDWVWVSDYEWGWAPFHYGRWVWIDGRGWVWIPGRVYRGAWVAWGVDDGYTYLGWYPMGPAFIWWGGVAVGYPYYVGPRWVYCPRGEVFSPVVGTRVVAGAAALPVAGRVRPYVPATPGVNAGPPPQKLGYMATQVPHATGAAAAKVARAQQFARPSTAQPLGAHAPTRVAMPAASSAAYAGTHGYSTSGSLAHPGAPAAGHALPGAAVVRPPAVTGGGRRPAPAPVPAPRVAPSFRGGGGGHFGGGGGHHR